MMYILLTFILFLNFLPGTMLNIRSIKFPQLTNKFFSTGLLFASLLCGNSYLCGCSEDPDLKYKELMTKVQTFKEEKKWEEARISLLSAIKLKPEVASSHYELAEIQGKLNQLSQAVGSYRATIDLDPNHRDARLRLAAILIAAAAPEQAEEHVDKLLLMNPDDNEALVLKSSILRARGKRPEASALLSQIIARDPQNKLAIANLGSIALDEGRFEEADKMLNKALSLDPDNGPVRLALVDLYIRRNELTKAEDTLKSLITSEPQNAALRYFYAEFLFARGIPDQAEIQYREVIKIDPTRHISRDRLYDLLLAKNERAQARELTANLQANDPKSLALAYFQGRDLEKEGKSQEAYKLYMSSIEQLPSFAPAFRRAGLVEIGRGENTQGLEHLRQAVALDTYDIGARMALGRILFRQKDYSGAENHAKQILSRYPNQVGASVLLADIALVEGRLDEARRIYELLVKTFPGNPDGLIKMGLLSEREKKTEDALTNYRKAIEFDGDINLPARRIAAIIARDKGLDASIEEISKLKSKSARNVADYELILGLLYMSRGKQGWEKAKQLLQSAVDKKPELTEAYLALARIGAAGGNLEGAIDQWKIFVEKNPQNISTRMMIGVSYEKLGKKAEATRYYREVLKLSPRFGPAANNLAWIMAETPGGDLNEAKQLAEVAQQEMSDEPAVMDTLAWVNYKLGSPRVAEPILADAVENERKRSTNGKVNPEILYHLGVIREAISDKQGAKEVLEEAQKTAPANSELADKITKLLSKVQ